MDEITSIGIWFFVIILSINAGIVFLAAQPGIAENGLMPGITPNTNLNNFDYSVPKAGVGGNTITSTEQEISNTWLGNMIKAADQITRFVRNLLFAWIYLLTGILTPLPGGAFFANIILPIIGLVQLVAFFIIGIRVAGVIRGVV